MLTPPERLRKIPGSCISWHGEKMRNPMKFLFLRTTIKVEAIIYSVPVPVLIYFSLFTFKFANRDPMMFMITVALAMAFALSGGSLVRWLVMRPMQATGNPEVLKDPRRRRRAELSCFTLPVVESISVFIRWLLAPAMFVSLPFNLFGKMTPFETVCTTIFTGITGLVSIPLVFHICETESVRFLDYLRMKGYPTASENPVRINIGARLVATLILVISYPAGLFLTLIAMSNTGYLDLRTIPIGFGLLIFCCTLLSVVVAVLFSRGVVNVMRNMNRNLAGVSKGDLTLEVTVRDGDEMGDLARNYTSVIDALGDSVQSVRDSARRLGQWVDDISSASRSLADASGAQQENTQSVLATVEQFSASLQTVTDRIANHANTVAESAAAVEELSAGVASIARGAETVKGTVQENVDSIGKGREKIQHSINETLQMDQSIAMISSTVRDIGARFESIEEILSAVQDISGQTNTLAMNAAIEAAHAGDAGRGFAIVATEVRRLAERSSQFVKEIGSVMKNIGRQVAEAVRTAEEAEVKSTAGRESAEEAQAAMEGIIASIDRIGSMVSDISRTTGEQAQAAAHALAGIDALRTFSQNVSEEIEAQAESAKQITQAIKAIGKSTEQNTGASQALSDLASALRSKSEELAVTVSRFRLREGSGNASNA
jgi:methyl-accepting chemotaxis protein